MFYFYLENGDVYCWGHSKKGQCAAEAVKDKLPLKITSPTKGIVKCL